MKLTRLSFLVVAVALLATAGMAVAAEGPGDISPAPGPRPIVDPPACAVMSWSPEMFSFYGDKATVLAKFQALDRDLLKHRTYAFIVESNRGSKLTFFELDKNGTTMDLGSANKASFSELSNQINNALLTNTGTKCAGMLTKELVAGIEMTHSVVARPASAGEAFQYALAAADGERHQSQQGGAGAVEPAAQPEV